MGPKWPKISFFLVFSKNFMKAFLDLASYESSLAQMPCLRKFWFLSYEQKGSQPVMLQDFINYNEI